MKTKKVKEIVSILMESTLYFELSLVERLELIRNLRQRVAIGEGVACAAVR